MARNPANPRGPYKKRPVAERFWKHVERTMGCFLWRGAANNKGYGLFNIGGEKLMLAHRFSYQQVHGEIPAGLVLDHLCRTPLCVRPDHLEAVTQSVNMQRSPLVGRSNRKTHCIRGHELKEPNLFFYPNGKRVCLTCKREKNRIWMRTYVKKSAR